MPSISAPSTKGIDELVALKARVLELQTARRKERDEAQKRISDLAAKKSTALESNEELERLRGAVVGLYVELKERDSESSDSKSVLKFSEQLKRTDSYVVADYLRAHVRTVLALKDDELADLQALTVSLRKEMAAHQKQAEQAQLQHQRSQVASRERIAELEKALRDSERHFNRRNKEGTQTGTSKVQENAVIGELRARIASQKEEIARLEATIKSREEEFGTVAKSLRNKEAEIRSQSGRLARISSLESQVQNLQLQERRELAKRDTLHKKEMEDVRSKLEHLTKLEAENSKLNGELRMLKEARQGDLANYTRKQVRELSNELQKVSRMLEDKMVENHTLSKQLAESQRMGEEASAANLRLKAEYDKLFKLAGSTSQKPVSVGRLRPKSAHSSGRHMSEEEVRKAVDENPHHVEFFKSKLREQEREVKRMKGRLRRLQAKEQQSVMREQRWETQIIELQKRLAQAHSSSGVAVGRIRPSSAASVRTEAFKDTAMGNTDPFSARASVSGEDDYTAAVASPVKGSASATAVWGESSEAASGMSASAGAEFFAELDSDEEQQEKRRIVDAAVRREAELSAQVNALQTKNRLLDQEVQELQNMRSLSQTVSEAYRRLLKQQEMDGRVAT